ncbi:MAG: hypothetical protein HYZ34_14585 [Ignavibacteriae bacterium]|nr:hypothetical protein [Ignavibacteriota bacterium]
MMHVLTISLFHVITGARLLRHPMNRNPRNDSVFMKYAFLILLCCLIQTVAFTQSSSSNDSLQRYLQFDETESLSFLITLFPPFLIQNGMELKEFIRSSEFKQLRTTYGDQKAIDVIFIRSMQLTHNNTGFSLLLSTLAVFDHRTLGFNVPLFKLFFPLSDESEEEFNQRVQNLPTKIFPHSPNTKRGDRDKLQHFFGSAFLTFAFESSSTAERFGTAIEQGEESFVVGGANDVQDERANRLGQRFGNALMENPFCFPSEFLHPETSLPSDSTK